MDVLIALKDSNGAYGDPETGLAITGEGPLKVKLTRFVAGLIYRGEADIYETTATRLASGEVTLETLPWGELKSYAVECGLQVANNTSKEKILAWFGENEHTHFAVGISDPHDPRLSHDQKGPAPATQPGGNNNNDTGANVSD